MTPTGTGNGVYLACTEQTPCLLHQDVPTLDPLVHTLRMVREARAQYHYWRA